MPNIANSVELVRLAGGRKRPRVIHSGALMKTIRSAELGTGRQRLCRLPDLAKRKIALILGVATMALAICTPAWAMVLLDWQSNDAGIVLDGSITRRTPFEVGWAIAQITLQHGHVLAFVLNSNGGTVEDAIRISLSIQKIGAPVMVLSGAECASACFLLLAAAPVKVMAPDALIAIHSARTEDRGEDTNALAATAMMAKLAAAYGVPDAIIGKLMRTTPNYAAVLTSLEMLSLPGAELRESVPFSSFTRKAVPVDEFEAGYAAGAYIAAGRSSYRSCQFAAPVFQAACVAGFRDALPERFGQGRLSQSK